MTISRDEFDRIENQIDDLKSLKNITDKIVFYKNKLDGISKDKLDDNQKIWLLANEVCEKRIKTSSREQILEDMCLLLKFIPDGE